MGYNIAVQTEAHRQDVKCTLTFPSIPGTIQHDDQVLFNIITGSRDKSVKLWQVKRNSPQIDEKSIKNPLIMEHLKTFSHHHHFVNALAYVPPSDLYAQGLILSGGSDKILYAFSPNLPSDSGVATSVETEEPLYALIGHEGNITTIEVAPEKEDLLTLTAPTIYSGSWDMSIRVWENWTCSHVMTGHTQAVWSIALLSNGYLASGSADKTIKLWNNFQCVKTLTGHTDVVRSLAKLPLTGFASSSNDMSIRLWSDLGEAFFVISGAHSSFIYTLSCLPNFQFVSAGEDKSIKIWSTDYSTKPIEVFQSPATSQWTICPIKTTESQSVLENDFIVGSSDGFIRVFSAVPNYWMSPKNLELYNAQVSCQKNEENIPNLTEAEISALPGPESLKIKTGNKDGEIVMTRHGATGLVEAHQWSVSEFKWIKVGDVLGSAKEEKKYDYVFSIDVSDSKPHLQLGYNNGENPWTVAENFITENDLPATYTNQIVDFILKNTPNDSTQIHPELSDISSSPYATVSSANLKGILSKLLEYNDKKTNTLVSKEDITQLVHFTMSPKSTAVLKLLLDTWDLEYLFPVYDIYRVRILDSDDSSSTIYGLYRLESLLSKSVLVNNDELLIKLSKCVIRLLVNLFSNRKTGLPYIISHTGIIVSLFSRLKSYANDASLVQSFIQNYGILMETQSTLVMYFDQINS